jgi:multidrug efflux pump
VTVDKVADQPRIVDESVWEFEKAFLEALAIVLAVCFLFLGWRTGIVVAASVPLVLALVAIVMALMGWNLDRISLGALIIALGLLVDDAIIAVEMMVVKIEQGWDRVRAATFRLHLHRLPHADRHAGDGGGLHAGGFRKVDQRRVRRRHLLGGGRGADRVLAGRGGVHALPGRGAAARRG